MLLLADVMAGSGDNYLHPKIPPILKSRCRYGRAFCVRNIVDHHPLVGAKYYVRGTSYTYDAESQMTSVGGGSVTSVNFGYDGDGNRVSKSTGKLYWYGVDGEVLEETDLAGAIKNEYLYFNGKRTGGWPT